VHGSRARGPKRFLSYIDAEGDAALIGAVNDICLEDNNTRLLCDPVITGMVKSANGATAPPK
jgi:hypothetical protein